MLGQIVIGVFFLVVLITSFTKPIWLLYLYAATLPLFGIIAEIGVQVTPFLMVSVGMLIVMFFGGIQKIVIPKTLFRFVLFSIGITFLMSFNLPANVSNYPALRGSLRWISQILVYLLLFAPVVYALYVRAGRASVEKMVTVFINVSAILALLGIIQLLVFARSGVDIFPIDMFSPAEGIEGGRSALTRIADALPVLRMSSLGAGEPKHFGYTCVVALNLVVLKMLYSSPQRPGGKIWLFILMIAFCICILFTFSTQAYLLLAINAVILWIIIISRFGILSKAFIGTSFILGIITILILKSNFVSRVIEARVYERIEETGVVEDFNLTIIDFLRDNPVYLLAGTGLGQVHFFAQDYIDRKFRYYMQDSVFVAKAGALRVVSEQGIIGFILLCSIMGYLIIHLRRFRKREAGFALLSLIIGFSILTWLNYFITSDSSPYYIFCFVLGFSMIGHLKRQK